MNINTIEPENSLLKDEVYIMEKIKKEAIEVICPRCRYTEIAYLPCEDFPRCPQCHIPMMINELLDEGKSY